MLRRIFLICKFSDWPKKYHGAVDPIYYNNLFNNNNYMYYVLLPYQLLLWLRAYHWLEMILVTVYVIITRLFPWSVANSSPLPIPRNPITY